MLSADLDALAVDSAFFDPSLHLVSAQDRYRSSRTAGIKRQIGLSS
jgi:hypothetical protein